MYDNICQENNKYSQEKNGEDMCRQSVKNEFLNKEEKSTLKGKMQSRNS